MKRKIFEQQTLDVETGEVKTITSVSVSKDTETWGMHRTTEGLEWIMQFTGNELQMLIVLLQLEDYTSGTVILSINTRKHIAKVFGNTYRHVQKIIQHLELKGALLRLSQDDILINPMYFYKGGTKSWKAKNERYIAFHDKLKSNDTN